MKPGRRSIPTAIKRAVLARDGLICRWCGIEVVRGGSPFVANYLHFDHVDPWANGGDHTLENLVVSCARCNLCRGKPAVNVRAAMQWFEYHSGRYWWHEGYAPPRLADPDECSWLLADYAATHHRTVPAVIWAIQAGKLAATGPGEPISVVPPESAPTNRRRWRR